MDGNRIIIQYSQYQSLQSLEAVDRVSVTQLRVSEN